jgi:post-segregation antitoxin (ccd killing protein)
MYDLKAPKRTVSLTLNSDLYSQVKALGINASQVAEEALARELAARRTAELKAEVRKDIEAMEAYLAKHGSFAQMVREHYESAPEDE